MEEGFFLDFEVMQFVNVQTFGMSNPDHASCRFHGFLPPWHSVLNFFVIIIIIYDILL